MDNINLSAELENIFKKVIQDVNDIALKPRWTYSSDCALSSPYDDHLNLLKEYVPSKYLNLVYNGVLRIEGDLEFFKLKSKKLRVLFFKQDDLSYKVNLDKLLFQLFYALKEIKYDIEDEITLLKSEILSKCDYYEITDFKALIRERLDNLVSLVDNQDLRQYLENKSFTEDLPYESYTVFEFADLLENRFNYIANSSIWNTNAYYGLAGCHLDEPKEDLHEGGFFKIDKGEWLQFERHFQLLKLYKAIAKLLSTQPSSITSLEPKSSSIFEGNAANILHEVLIELNGIDDNGPVARKFQPICSAFYQLHLDRSFELLKSTTLLKDFIIYLNKPDIYDAKIKNDNKLSSGANHYDKVKKLVRIGLNRAIQG